MYYYRVEPIWGRGGPKLPAFQHPEGMISYWLNDYYWVKSPTPIPVGVEIALEDFPVKNSLATIN